jgi:hypothetical protein
MIAWWVGVIGAVVSLGIGVCVGLYMRISRIDYDARHFECCDKDICPHLDPSKKK